MDIKNADVRLRLTKRRHYPVLLVNGYPHWVWYVPIMALKEWNVSRKAGKLGMKFCNGSLYGMSHEWGDWERWYLPPKSVHRWDLILDVGARDGDTAWFYVQHGYRNLRLVEPDPRRWPSLEANAKALSKHYHAYIEVRKKPFSADDLEGVKFVKGDCEGCPLEGMLKELKVPYGAELHNPGMQVNGIYVNKKSVGYAKG